MIREAIKSDSQSINRVSHYLGYSKLSSNRSMLKLQEMINSPYDYVYVAEVKGQIVGWIHLFYARRLASENFYEIGGLVVSPDFRGQGIGKNLVQFALSKNKGKFRVRCNELRVKPTYPRCMQH